MWRVSWKRAWSRKCSDARKESTVPMAIHGLEQVQWKCKEESYLSWLDMQDMVRKQM